MVLLDNYIGRAVITSVISVLFVLTILFLLIAFAGEFDDIGKHDYTFWKAMAYVLLRSPRQVYELFPLAAILGTMLGLGALASRSELIIIRSAGISIWRIVLSVIRASVLLMLMAFLLGEVIAPPTERYAQQMRLTALSKISFRSSSVYSSPFLRVSAIKPLQRY